jgi:hypothetical protein
VSTRASAAKDALVDKKDEKSHDTKADVHKGKTPLINKDMNGILMITSEAAKQ